MVEGATGAVGMVEATGAVRMVEEGTGAVGMAEATGVVVTGGAALSQQSKAWRRRAHLGASARDSAEQDALLNVPHGRRRERASERLPY